MCGRCCANFFWWGFSIQFVGCGCVCVLCNIFVLGVFVVGRVFRCILFLRCIFCGFGSLVYLFVEVVYFFYFLGEDVAEVESV